MDDGMRGMLPREKMCEGAKRYWDCADRPGPVKAQPERTMEINGGM